MKVNEIKSVSNNYEENESNTLESGVEVLEVHITTMSNNKCDTLIGEDYNGDVSITTLDLQQALRVLENISSTEEMI